MYRFHGSFNSKDINTDECELFGDSGRYKVRFLGTLHNFIELKENLEKSGETFLISSNEELIFQSYKKFGTDFIKTLNGSFVLLIADSKEKKIVIARDQFGKVPLYYAHREETIFFSTDTKTLTSTYEIANDLCKSALNYYFALRYIPGELSIFKNIKKLPSATYLTFNAEKNEIKINTYWTTPKNDPKLLNENEVSEKLEELLINSILKRTSNDIETGAFLSGGIDSGLNVALLSKIKSKKIKTFTIGFKEKKYDESGLSRIIAEHFGTNHFELNLTPESKEHFEKIGEIFDEPLGDPSIIPTYYACKIASGNCKEIFCGEGADGLFLGLKTHGYAVRYKNIYKYLKYLNPLLGNIQKFIPNGINWKIFIKGLNPDQFFLERNIQFNKDLRSNLFSKNVIDELKEKLHSPEEHSKDVFNSYNGSYKGKLGNYNSTCFTDNALAMRVRMTRHFRLKYVTPFLDKDLTEFCLSNINPELKIRNGIKKYILKKVAKKYLPPEIPIERKRGFNAPIGSWFRNEWWNYAREKIMDVNDEIINRETAEKILLQHKNKSFDQSRKIFSLLMFKLWEEKNLT